MASRFDKGKKVGIKMNQFVKSHGLGNDYFVLDKANISFEINPEVIDSSATGITESARMEYSFLCRPTEPTLASGFLTQTEAQQKRVGMDSGFSLNFSTSTDMRKSIHSV